MTGPVNSNQFSWRMRTRTTTGHGMWTDLASHPPSMHRARYIGWGWLPPCSPACLPRCWLAMGRVGHFMKTRNYVPWMAWSIVPGQKNGTRPIYGLQPCPRRRRLLCRRRCRSGISIYLWGWLHCSPIHRSGDLILFRGAVQSSSLFPRFITAKQPEGEWWRIEL